MAINIYNIKKWHKMLTGKSVLHVNQDLGKYFEAKELKGYYNNMMEKVSYVPHLVDSEELPVLHTESGGTLIFPNAVLAVDPSVAVPRSCADAISSSVTFTTLFASTVTFT